MIKAAINGYGRIGRNIVRAIYESNRNEQIKIGSFEFQVGKRYYIELLYPTSS